MAPVSTTEKASAAFCNKLNRLGKDQEVWASKDVHAQGIPLLIVPGLLRRLGAGQIDLAVLCLSQKGEELLKIYEVKSSLRLSEKQRRRLKKSAQLLSQLLQIPSLCFLKVVREKTAVR